MKRVYSVRVTKEKMEKLVEITGQNYSATVETLLDAYLSGGELNVVQAPQEGVYILKYIPKAQSGL